VIDHAEQVHSRPVTTAGAAAGLAVHRHRRQPSSRPGTRSSLRPRGPSGRGAPARPAIWYPPCRGARAWTEQCPGQRACRHPGQQPADRGPVRRGPDPRSTGPPEPAAGPDRPGWPARPTARPRPGCHARSRSSRTPRPDTATDGSTPAAADPAPAPTAPTPRTPTRRPARLPNGQHARMPSQAPRTPDHEDVRHLRRSTRGVPADRHPGPPNCRDQPVKSRSRRSPGRPDRRTVEV
jgi:hypothetical protein